MTQDVKIHPLDGDIITNETAGDPNKSLLVKMLKNDFLTTLAKSDKRGVYESNIDNILLLPGIWDDDLFLCDKGCVMKGIVRNINDVQVGDKLFVLGASSFINNLENDTIEDAKMQADATDIINKSETSVTLTSKSGSRKLTKKSGDPEGQFYRKDLPADNYSLEPGVWRESVKEIKPGVWRESVVDNKIRGAYSSLFCIIEFPSTGHYQLEIENSSELYNASLAKTTPEKKFELEVKYEIEVKEK